MSTVQRMKHDSAGPIRQPGLRPYAPRSVASRIRMDVQHFGILKTAYLLLMKGINLFVDFRIVRVVAKEVVDPSFLESNQGPQCKFLDKSQLLELSRNPENQLTESFIQTALERGDECFASFDGQVLTGVTWYSNKPTDDDGLMFHFGPDYMYGYAGFTNPKYRGRRLSPLRASRSRREFLDRGFKGTISLIDSHNFRSLRSSAGSPGHQDLGCILVLKISRCAWIYNSRGCREHGVYLAKPTAVQPVPKA